MRHPPNTRRTRHHSCHHHTSSPGSQANSTSLENRLQNRRRGKRRHRPANTRLLPARISWAEGPLPEPPGSTSHKPLQQRSLHNHTRSSMAAQCRYPRIGPSIPNTSSHKSYSTVRLPSRYLQWCRSTPGRLRDHHRNHRSRRSRIPSRHTPACTPRPRRRPRRLGDLGLAVHVDGRFSAAAAGGEQEAGEKNQACSLHHASLRWFCWSLLWSY